MIELDVFAAIVGQRNVLTGADVEMRDTFWGRHSPCQARAILRPGSTEEVSQILKLCHSAGQPVVTHGGLTGLTGAADADSNAIVLSTERMTTIETMDATDRTAIVGAGVTVQQVQEAADAIGMHFPVDFGARGSATIGGAISTNAGGNRVFRFGSTREQVLGLEVVLADGTIVRSLKGLVKDNTGYDLKHWFIGAEGTLGIVTRACLRLRTRSNSSMTALLAVKDFDAIPHLLNRLESDLAGQLSAFEAMWSSFYKAVSAKADSAHLPADYPLYVLIEAQGADQELDQDRFEAVLMTALEQGMFSDAIIAKSERERQQLWAMRDDIESIFGYGAHADFDVSLPISAMASYIDDLQTALRELDPALVCFCFGHVADGNLHVIVAHADGFGEGMEKRITALVYEPIAAIGGSVSAEHGVGLAKRPYLHLSRSPEELRCMAMMKRALDPLNLLNPGKILFPELLSTDM